MEQPSCGRQVITLRAAWPWAFATSTMQVLLRTQTAGVVFAAVTAYHDYLCVVE